MQNFDWLLGCFSGTPSLSKRTFPFPHELSKIKTFENIKNTSLQETHIDLGMLESQTRQTKSHEQNGVASPATRLDIGLIAKTRTILTPFPGPVLGTQEDVYNWQLRLK
jgi:hypothetical protein